MTSQPSVAAHAEGLTIPKLLHRNAIEYGQLPAITSLDDPAAPTLSWRRFHDEILATAAGLAELGLTRGDRMLIMAETRPEHFLVDLAAAQLGALSCTAYQTLSQDQIQFVAAHSAATVVVLGGAGEVARWLPVLDRLPALRAVVVMDTGAVPADQRFIALDTLRTNGKSAGAIPDWNTIQPDDPLSMIYTSGTTGDPKAVVLSHRNAIHEAYAVRQVFGTPMHGRNIAYLPLAHIAERELSMYIPIVWAGHVHTLADPAGIVSALSRVRPQSFFGVPRVWEKMAAALQNMLANAPEERRTALTAAGELLREGYRLRSAGQPVPAELAERIATADGKVMAPVRELIGLDHLAVSVSGSAALPVAVIHFLAGLGVEIEEVWGLSETTGAATANSPSDFRAGTVGRPVPDMEVRVGEDGELFVRGPIVFLGYLRADGSIEPGTDEDGWLATGDIGVIDDDGFITITERKKELIITAGGKNIAPTKVEGLLEEHALVGQAVAIGDARPYVTALVVLDDETAPAWASTHGIEATDIASLATHPSVQSELDRAVAAANDRLSRSEQIKRYRILSTTWTPESGELTPTLKLKRRVIMDRYGPTIESLYG